MEWMKPLVLLVLFFAATKAKPRTPAVDYLGVGYNLIDGNPEGDPEHGNVDPGLKHTRRMLALTYNANRRTNDDKISLPDQATYSPRLSCTAEVKKSSYHGAKGYQKQLQVGVSVTASYKSSLYKFSFSASNKFRNYQSGSSSTTEINSEERRVCNRGTARYQLERAGLPNSHINLQAGFVADIKRLPTSYNQDLYGQFLNRWGTHVVTQVTVGSIYSESITITRKQALEYALTHNNVGLSVSGGFAGASGSVSVNVDKLTSDRAFKKSFNYKKRVNARGSTITFRDGEWQYPKVTSFLEPIKINIISIDKIMTSEFTSDNGVLERRQYIVKALREYPKYRSLRPPSDSPVQFPIAWPKGKYGLVKPKYGCPSGSNSVFRTGKRKHDTEDNDANNKWSHTYSLAGYKAKNNMRWEFCIKVSNGKDNINYDWPKGKYCILRFGNHCPTSFETGEVYWDDEDSRNSNKHSGKMPDGVYDRNTRMFFCCRNDGETSKPIILPTNRPFILMPTQKGRACQSVFRMRVSRQWFRWDDEDDNNKSLIRGESHPFDEGGPHNHKLYFCVYQK